MKICWRPLLIAVMTFVVFIDLSYGRNAQACTLRNESEFDGFYFVALFDGVFPIPSRYILIEHNSSSHNGLEYSGSLISSYTSSKPLPGRIFIGPIEDCEVCLDDEVLKKLGGTALSNTRQGQLNIKKILLGEGSKKVEVVTIYNHKDYIKIFDQDKNLSKTLINKYLKANHCDFPKS